MANMKIQDSAATLLGYLCKNAQENWVRRVDVRIGELMRMLNWSRSKTWRVLVWMYLNTQYVGQFVDVDNKQYSYWIIELPLGDERARFIATYEKFRSLGDVR